MSDKAPDTEALPVRQRVQHLEEDALCVRAPAKINLNLLVGPRRQDGYHELDSMVAKVSLYDEIDLRPRDDGQITLDCADPDCGPADKNLAMVAATLLSKVTHVGGADIALRKSIPPGKGLGGGSSDAAAMLEALDEMWRLGLGKSELMRLAAQVGSDVTLFLGGPAVRMTGRGERIDRTVIHPFYAVLYMPGFSCATKQVYDEFDRQPTQSVAPQLDMPRLASCPPSDWRRELRNDLAEAAMRVCEPLRDAHDRLVSAVPVPVHVTGSGSAMFMLCDNAKEASTVLSCVPFELRQRCVVVCQNPW